MDNYFSKNLKHIREQKNLSQSGLARRTEEICEKYNQNHDDKLKPTTQASINRWESGENSPSIDSIIVLAHALNIDVPQFIGVDLTIDNGKIINLPNRTIKIPILGRIPAGTPIEAIEDVLGYEEIPEDWTRGNKEFFALQINGNSMYPEYNDKDVIIVLQQPDCETGDDAVVMVNGDDATFKRVIKQDSGIILKPLNNEYNPTMFTDDDIISKPVKILGIAKEVRRKIKQ